jgi:hypothetical protein
LSVYKLHIMQFEEKTRKYAETPLSKQLLLDILHDYKRPYDKIDELVKENRLVQVKRGLYVPGPRLNIASPEPFLVANHLYGPSYVSADSALSYWGLIPEKVYEVCSFTTRRTKIFQTVVGKFSFKQLPMPYYSFGISQVALSQKQTVLMASKEKALCDKVVTTPGVLLRSIKQARALLLEDFRIDKESLRNLDLKVMGDWLHQAPKAESLAVLLKTLDQL